MEGLLDLGRNPSAGGHFAALPDRPLANLLGCLLRRTFGTLGGYRHVVSFFAGPTSNAHSNGRRLSPVIRKLTRADISPSPAHCPSGQAHTILLECVSCG
nr:hypothetical protein JVH1_0719 [Rhodococcus sp. JVH1]